MSVYNYLNATTQNWHGNDFFYEKIDLMTLPTHGNNNYCRLTIKTTSARFCYVLFHLDIQFGTMKERIVAFLAANSEKMFEFTFLATDKVAISGYVLSLFRSCQNANIEIFFGEKFSLAKGINVSRQQSPIEWQHVVASGVQHVFIDMTEGATFVDRTFVTNWHEARTHHLKLGAYHHYRALSSTGKEQCRNIICNLSRVGFDPKKDLLAINVDRIGNENATPEQIADNLYQFLLLLKQEPLLDGQAPLIYCSPEYWNNSVRWDRHDFSVYPLWVVDWDVDIPQLPWPWAHNTQSWIWWQYDNKGQIDGIVSDVALGWVKNEYLPR